MRNKIRIGTVFIVLLWLYFNLKAGEGTVPKEENREPILTDDNIIDLGNHTIAYRTSSAKRINSLADEKCVIVYALDMDHDNLICLPDVYGEIYDMRMEGPDSIYISYGDADNGRIHSVYIPVCFPSREDYVIGECDRGRFLIEAQRDVAERVAELPKTVWEESVVWKEKAYTVTFERISLVADLDYLAGGRYADYHLTVKDGAENIIFQRTMINYPVTYEEVYWFTDLSGDGFPDIIFCTDHYIGRNSYMTLHFMIWNAEIGTYEPKPLPEPLSIPLWNDAHSSVIGFSQTEEKTTLKMFTCRNGEWELSGQLLPVYEEDEEGNLIYQCYKEVFYADGEIAEENVIMTKADEGAIWFDEESFWSKYNAENVILYPVMDCWEKIVITIGKETVHKYQKK